MFMDDQTCKQEILFSKQDLKKNLIDRKIVLYTFVRGYIKKNDDGKGVHHSCILEYEILWHERDLYLQQKI